MRSSVRWIVSTVVPTHIGGGRNDTDDQLFVRRYSVVGHGFKTVRNSTCFTFELKRAANQPDLEKALVHPTADEYDDWMDYNRTRDEQRAAERAEVDHITLLRAINEMDGSQDTCSQRLGQWRFSSDDEYMADDEA